MPFVFEFEQVIFRYASEQAAHSLEAANSLRDQFGIANGIRRDQFTHGPAVLGDLKYFTTFGSLQQLAEPGLCFKCSDDFRLGYLLVGN
jgi:hypothetical protein